MDAVTCSSPPTGAPTFAVVVWIRPDVHAPPWSSAVMSRSPWPSRYTLRGELVMVSISPVPNLEPGPVSYFQADDGALPAAPSKSSLNTVDQPAGGGGTSTGQAATRGTSPDEAASRGTAEAATGGTARCGPDGPRARGPGPGPGAGA